MNRIPCAEPSAGQGGAPSAALSLDPGMGPGAEPPTSPRTGPSAQPLTVPDAPEPGLAPLDVVIVAAGTSARMGGTDKLAADLCGLPVLARAIAPFAAMPEVDRIVVVTAADRVAGLRSAPWLSGRVSAVVAGGARRQDSVAAGVRWLAGSEGSVVRATIQLPVGAAPADLAGSPGPTGQQPVPILLVHDGARPLVDESLIRRVAHAARRYGAAIPVVSVADTVKRIEDDRVTGTIDRSGLAIAQTPQAVRLDLLADAYARFPPSDAPTWTDEAALLEACTITVHAVSGDPGNLKVTTPADLDRAAAILVARDPRRDSAGDADGGSARRFLPPPRIGLGVDSHPFGPGEPLFLGGVALDGVARLDGHSDGDVVLHAIADALLGAAALGDLGRLFPAGPQTPRGIAGSVLIEAVVANVHGSGLRPASVDVTIVAARPRLGPRLDSIRASVAGLLGLPESRVSIKASTGNLDGMEGAGRGISASVIATLEALESPV